MRWRRAAQRSADPPRTGSCRSDARGAPSSPLQAQPRGDSRRAAGHHVHPSGEVLDESAQRGHPYTRAHEGDTVGRTSMLRERRRHTGSGRNWQSNHGRRSHHDPCVRFVRLRVKCRHQAVRYRPGRCDYERRLYCADRPRSIPHAPVRESQTDGFPHGSIESSPTSTSKEQMQTATHSLWSPLTSSRSTRSPIFPKQTSCR